MTESAKELNKVEAYIKYVRMSSKKLLEVARELKGRDANEALELLKFIPRKSARIIYKALQSAIANAENNHDLVSEKLKIEGVYIEQGPSFRRFRPAARGSAHPVKKRTSHVRVVLTNK